MRGGGETPPEQSGILLIVREYSSFMGKNSSGVIIHGGNFSTRNYILGEKSSVGTIRLGKNTPGGLSGWVTLSREKFRG